MFKTLAEGINGSGMTAYEFLPIEDRFGVIHYIRKTFWRLSRDNKRRA